MTAPSARQAPTAPLSLAFGGLVALAAAMGVGRFIYTPILPLMTEDLGLSQGEAGLIASANFAGYLAGALAAAAPFLPGSRLGWFLGALAASAATTAMMGFDGGLGYFAGMRFLGGVASAFVLVMSSTVVLDRLESHGRGALAATHFAGVGVGIAASALLMIALARLGGGWRAGWIAAGALSAAALAAAALLIPPREEPMPAAATARREAPAPGFLALALAYGLLGFGYVITATFIVAQVRMTPETRPLEPYVWLLVGLSAAPSVALWVGLSRRVEVYRAYAIAGFAQAAGVAASALWPSIPGLTLAALCVGGTFMGMTALGLMGARALAGADPRRALALMTAAFGTGQIVGPAFAGLVHDATGSFAGPTLVAAAALAGGSALAMVARRAASRHPS